MPVLLQEDGSGLPDSNTYADLYHANLYHASRSVSGEEWMALAPSGREARLLDARVMLDSSYTWRGQIVSENQALYWPRDFVYDDAGRLLPSDEVPPAVLDAQSQLAWRLSRSESMFGHSSTGLTSERLGRLTRTWSSSGRGVETYPELDHILGGLIAYGGQRRGFNQQRLIRWS